MKFEVSSNNISEIKADIEFVVIIGGRINHSYVLDQKELKEYEFDVKKQSIIYLANKRRVYISILNLNDPDELRDVIAKATRSIKNKKIKSIKIASYQTDEITINDSVKAIVDGFIFGIYEFDFYKTEKSVNNIKSVIISSQNYTKTPISSSELKNLVEESVIIAESTNFTKDIVNKAPDEITPKKLADIAKQLTSIKYVTCKVYNQKFLEKENMGAFLAVSRSSIRSPKLICLTYKPKKVLKKITLVGKGLTYDSGGLSLKPSDAMIGMKCDKSGACATLGILRAVALLGLPVEINVIIGATENMIGGDSFKPDDILVSKSGKTIEVRNTDAEGRLVLCDCLTYAQENTKFDYILDFATLTGACLVALGEFTIGILGHSNKLKHQFFNASRDSGELVGSLPFNRHLKKHLDSKIADISNISSTRFGGTITAAMYLDSFIDDKNKDKWLHLDIAGPAYLEKDWGYNTYGASGAGVRITVSWILNLLSKGL